jgi:proteasome lid subunit RPN8/RPN11
MLFYQSVTDAAKDHAAREFPNESVGLVRHDAYVPLKNVSPTPRTAYDCAAELAQHQVQGGIQAMIHSHPTGNPVGPSALDMSQQQAMHIPYGIIVCSVGHVEDPYFWSDTLEPPPLEGRQFRHGPSGTDGRGDCYALIRDYYRVKMNTRLPEFPRDDNWWINANSHCLYEDNFRLAGFQETDRKNPLAGDVILMRYPPGTRTANHAAIFLGGQQLLHHLTNRVSRTEPSINYMRFVVRWLRHAA